MRSCINWKRICAAALAACLCVVCAGAEEFYADGAYTDQYYAEDQFYADPAQMYASLEPGAGINGDADIRLGCVVSTAAEINPFRCVERDLISVNRLVFESLVELDENSRPVPMLADRWETQDKMWMFHLREGVSFHNGVILSANDVVLSYSSIMSSGANTPYAQRLGALVDSMEVLDTYTVGVRAKYSGYITLYAMTFPIVETGTFGDSLPRGTGPYWYTEYAQGSGVRLEMNPLWWKNDAKVHSIAAIDYYDSGDALEALQTGAIDMLCTQSNRASLSRRLSNLTGMDYITNGYELLVPNLESDSVMSDLRMRQAVMYAIDRASVTENAYGGMGIQCEVPVNPNSWLYESQSTIYYYSPERAYQLIKDCGWSDLTNDGKFNRVDGVRLVDLEITIVTYNESAGSVRENAANLIASYLENLGVTVNVVTLDKAEALHRIEKGNYDLALIGIQLSEIPTLSALIDPKGSLNLNGYSDNMLEGYSKQIESADELQLKTVFSQIQMHIVENLPILGLLFRTGSVLSTRSLAGLSAIRAGDTLNGLEFLDP